MHSAHLLLAECRVEHKWHERSMTSACAQVPWHAVWQVQGLQQQLRDVLRERGSLQRELEAAQAAAASARDSAAGLQRQVAVLEEEAQAGASDTAGALQQLKDQVRHVAIALMSCCMSAALSFPKPHC